MKGMLRRLASESAVYGLSGVVSRFLSIFLVPIYTRVFAPEDYGVISLITTTMAAVSIFVVLSLDSAAHRWFWETEEAEDRKRTFASWATLQIAVAIAFAAAITLVSEPLARLVVDRADAGVYFRIAAWVLPLSTLGTVCNSWLRVQRRPWATVAFATGVVLTTIGLTILLVVGLDMGIAGVFWAQLGSAAFGTVVALSLLRGWVDPRRFNGERIRAMLRYALPLIPSGVALWVISMADRYFVQAFASTDEVGLYHIGYAIASIAAVATRAFQQAWGPFSLSIHKEAGARDVYANTLIAYAWLAGGIAAAVSLFAPEALRVLATRPYYGAWTVVPFLAFGHVMNGLTFVAAVGPSIVHRTGPIGAAISIAAVINIALSFVLTAAAGKEGAAVATLVSQVFVPAYLFYWAQRIYPIPFDFRRAAVTIGAAGAVTAVGLMLPLGSPWLSVPVKLALLVAFAVGFSPLRPRRTKGSTADAAPVEEGQPL